MDKNVISKGEISNTFHIFNSVAQAALFFKIDKNVLFKELEEDKSSVFYDDNLKERNKMTYFKGSLPDIIFEDELTFSGARWRFIEENDKYLISDDGRVKNLISGKIRSPSITPAGYMALPIVFVNQKGIKKQGIMTIHRLVAMAFIPNPSNYRCVNHKDGNKLNNHYTNLEWCTHQDNIGKFFAVNKKTERYLTVGRHVETGAIENYTSVYKASELTGCNYLSIKSRILSGDKAPLKSLKREGTYQFQLHSNKDNSWEYEEKNKKINYIFVKHELDNQILTFNSVREASISTKVHHARILISAVLQIPINHYFFTYQDESKINTKTLLMRTKQFHYYNFKTKQAFTGTLGEIFSKLKIKDYNNIYNHAKNYGYFRNSRIKIESVE